MRPELLRLSPRAAAAFASLATALEALEVAAEHFADGEVQRELDAAIKVAELAGEERHAEELRASLRILWAIVAFSERMDGAAL